jgi:hypothetical protein
MSMKGASKTLVACAAAIGLSALICTPARAQPSNLAPATQPGDKIGHSGTASLTAGPLPELAVTPASTALGSQSTPPPSITTRALLPGHWTLHGSNYVWVPPETRLREVQAAALVQGSYLWRNGLYVWVPTHYQP